MKLILLRHGLTEANEQQLYCGSTDLPLSDKGKAALRGKRFPHAARYYSSAMRRADETMQLLYPGVSFARVPDLREMDFGRFEMKSYAQLCQTPEYQKWLSGDNGQNRCPDGESGADLLQRALPALERILADQSDAVVITHGGVIAAAMAHWFPEKMRSRYDWQSAHGEGYAVTFQDAIPVHYIPLCGTEEDVSDT